MCSKIGDINYNHEKIKFLTNRDVEGDTDLIVLPEVWTCGWSTEHFQSCGEYIENSKTIKLLSQIAVKFNSFVIGGSFIEKVNENLYYNTCPVIDRKGNLIAKYSKNHLFSYYGCNEGKYITRGDSPVMVNIDGVKAGLTICYDIRFPEIYRAYRKAEADIFINAAAWGLKKPVPWECMTRSRAVENQTYMVALTQCGPIDENEWNIGHSRIIDYKGESIAEIKNQKEGAMTAVINFDDMYEFREKCTILNDIKENYEVKIL